MLDQSCSWSRWSRPAWKPQMVNGHSESGISRSEGEIHRMFFQSNWWKMNVMEFVRVKFMEVHSSSGNLMENHISWNCSLRLTRCEFHGNSCVGGEFHGLSTGSEFHGISWNFMKQLSSVNGMWISWKFMPLVVNFMKLHEIALFQSTMVKFIEFYSLLNAGEFHEISWNFIRTLPMPAIRGEFYGKSRTFMTLDQVTERWISWNFTLKVNFMDILCNSALHDFHSGKMRRLMEFHSLVERIISWLCAGPR